MSNSYAFRWPDSRIFSFSVCFDRLGCFKLVLLLREENHDKNTLWNGTAVEAQGGTRGEKCELTPLCPARAPVLIIRHALSGGIVSVGEPVRVLIGQRQRGGTQRVDDPHHPQARDAHHHQTTTAWSITARPGSARPGPARPRDLPLEAPTGVHCGGVCFPARFLDRVGRRANSETANISEILLASNVFLYQFARALAPSSTSRSHFGEGAIKWWLYGISG